MEASLAYSSVDLLRARRRLHIVGRYTSPVWDRQNHSQLGLTVNNIYHYLVDCHRFD